MRPPAVLDENSPWWDFTGVDINGVAIFGDTTVSEQRYIEASPEENAFVCFFSFFFSNFDRQVLTINDYADLRHNPIVVDTGIKEAKRTYTMQKRYRIRT